VTLERLVISAMAMGKGGRSGTAGGASRRRRGHWAWALALFAGAVACNDEPPGEVRLATWWGQRGEFVEPFETLKQSLLERAGLGVDVVSATTSKAYHMQWVDTQLNPKTESPAALDVVAYNNGGDVLRWTKCGRSPYAPQTARLRAVDDAALGPLHLDASWIEGSFDPEVLSTIKCDQHYYALPVGLHQVNTLFYNKRLLRASGFDVDQDGSGQLALPSSLDELEAAASAIYRELHTREGGPADASVFALPRSDNWTLSLFFIENIMLASAGAERYQRYWSGAECDASLFARALSRVRELEHADYFSSRNLSEKDALQELVVGNAAFMVTGDWAAAEIDPNEVGYMAFPGTQDLFVFTADVFALPDMATSDVENGLAWLRAVTGLETQREFAQRKHALSARSDDPERPMRGQRVRSLPAFLPGTEIDAPSDYQEAFQSLSGQLLDWLVAGSTGGARLAPTADREGPFEAPAALIRAAGDLEGSGADASIAAYAAGECDKLRAAAAERGDAN
jgi:glucose/mannose transport system substrate-binding protein